MKYLREEQKDWAIMKDQVEQLNTIGVAAMVMGIN